MKRFPLFMCITVLVGFLSASSMASFEPQAKDKKDEKSDKDKSKEKDKDKDKAKADEKKADSAPKPLFQGSLGIKSSRQGKDSAALGFNGIAPDGKVEKTALAAVPTKLDTVNAMALVAYNPTPDELKQFVADGNLKAGTPPTAQPEEKKKKK